MYQYILSLITATLYIVVLNIALITFLDCQLFSSCQCRWNKCCTLTGCDNCKHTFSCQIEITNTGSVGTVGWCTVEVNDTLIPPLISTINITFESYSDCTSCINGDNMCCGPNDIVMPVNCSTASTYSALAQSSDVYSDTTLITTSLVTPMVSIKLIGPHFLLTNSHFTINAFSITTI